MARDATGITRPGDSARGVFISVSERQKDALARPFKELLAKNGIKPEAGPGPRSCARGTSTSVYFRDPDDNLVEFTVY